MSLSLVAYDSSDEESENEETESAGTIIASNANNDTVETLTLQTDSKLSAAKVVSYDIKDKENKEEKSSDTEDFDKHFLSTLPKPKGFVSIENVEENDDILLKKETKCQAIKPAKKQTIKISVPSLSEVNIASSFRENKFH